MHHGRLLLGMMLAAIVSLPIGAAAQSNVGGAASDIKNEKVIRELYQKFTAAWNRHDALALGSMYTIDGDHMEPDGDHADGRDAVSLLLKRQHEGVFKDTTLMLSIDDVWFVAEGVCLVDANYALAGARTADGRTLPERRGHVTSVLLKENGKWLIAASRSMVPTELPYKRE